jgi:hypothetical protein
VLTEEIFAMRLVAQRCLYGVDRNSVAVNLAKMSLWLVTLAKDHALTFVDHALRHGDSLVGLSRKQIEAFHWDVDAPRFQAGFETMQLREHVAKVAKLRRHIRESDESVSDSKRRDLWDQAKSELGNLRLYGDLVLAAFAKPDSGALCAATDTSVPPARSRPARLLLRARGSYVGDGGKALSRNRRAG